MPANKAVCVSELSASLPTPPAQPQLHNHCLDSLITPPQFSPQGWIEGLWGEDDEGKGKPPSKNIKRQCVPASLKDSRFPHPSLQGSNSFFPDLNLPHMPVPVRPLNSGKYGIWKEKGLGRGGEHIPERAGLPFVSLYSPLFKDTRWPLQWCVWEVGGRLEQESCFYGSLNTRVHSCLISACSLMEGRKRRGHNEWNRCASSMQWMASKKVWGEACFSLNYWDGLHTNILKSTSSEFH